ncbi:MAG: NADH-quinone oxidoreductase subunit G [Alphaproteobacteria bacterium]|nr:NADH-quinone oxidoreductase subunit G [Alphaproteobacteria bacterium]
MVKLTIDGTEVEVPAGSTVIQACEQVGIEIPRFCYHERLEIAGTCRMCLVEISPGPPKPQASCAMPVAENMVVKTDTPMIKKAREGVMEFLLANHPLDCPICDQGGECDLQDQAMAYGRGSSRFHEHKRAVKDKYMGPLVKTQMTRCIHCTRCIRFMEDVAGVPELGAVNRGGHMEVTTYIEKALTSELSGNIIDLCPVGALTSKPYAFTARPWELKHTESIDVMDAVGSNIRLDSRGPQVVRVLPRLNEDVNEEWISDKTRFACDGLKLQRLDRPMVRKGGKLQEATWQEAFDAIVERTRGLPGEKIAAIAGDLADCEAMMALKDLMDKLGSPHTDCRQDGAHLDASIRAGYLFNTTIAGIEQADYCLLIGSNPRHEAPIINARLRKRYLAGGFHVASVGPEVELTYPVEELGNDSTILEKSLGSNTAIVEALKKAERPMIIIGQGALKREDGAQLLALVRQLAEKYGVVKDGWNGFNVLHTAAARVGGLDLGFVPGEKGRDVRNILRGTLDIEIEVVYLLGADEIDMSRLGRAFVIYQGHHGDKGAHRADVILPGAAYTEKDATYVNTEGRVQQTQMAIFPPGQAKEDWKIVRALSEAMGRKLPYDTLEQLRARMVKLAPHFAKVGEVAQAAWGAFGAKGSLKANSFDPAIENFYMTDPISRVSPTMAECSAKLWKKGGTPDKTGKKRAA